jgi:hypothetical protein
VYRLLICRSISYIGDRTSIAIAARVRTARLIRFLLVLVWGRPKSVKALCEAAGIDYGYARECKHVAARVELLVRTNNLTFAHHQSVASLPDDEATGFSCGR